MKRYGLASIGHIAIGMAAARRLRRGRESRWPIAVPMLFWGALSLLPDADVLGFGFGVRYADEWGHRGATHSLAFAVAVGLVIGAVARLLGDPWLRTTLFAIAVVVSHPLLDTLTNGGLGCALFWPFDVTRYFAPWRPIPVAPIGGAFFSSRGLYVAVVELVLFLPFFIYALWPRRTAPPDWARDE